MTAVAQTFKKYGIQTKLFGPENMGLADWFFQNNKKFVARYSFDANGNCPTN
jgi:hypothetical protein